MKTVYSGNSFGKKCVVLIGLLIGWAAVYLPTMAQDPPRIDPRQFVTIYELNRHNNKRDTAYHHSRQRRQVLNVNSTIEIEFDKAKIAHNLDFYGNISIVADISNRRIEVSPYSEVGKEQSAIGISTGSPREIASYLLGLLGQVSQLKSSLDIMLEDYILEEGMRGQYDNLKISLNASMEYLLEYYTQAPQEDTTAYAQLNPILQAKLQELVRYLNSPTLEFYLNNALTFRIVQIRRELEDAQVGLTKIDFKNVKPKPESKLNKYKDIKRNVDLSLKYLDYFLRADKETELVFIDLTKIDKIFLTELHQQLGYISEKLNFIDTVSNMQLFERSEEKMRFAVQNCRSMAYLFYTSATSAMKTAQFGNIDEFLLNFKNISYKPTYNYTDSLAAVIAPKIYSKLFNGIINLKQDRAQEGNLLNVALLWYQYSDSTSRPIVLHLASFELKEAGWRLKVSDTFMLIERLNEGTQLNNNLSPTNFKGAAGVSLLYSYGTNRVPKARFFKALEPSIGINVSYLDFFTDKDLELGTGIVLGLFRNRFFFTGGYNLHAEAKSPFYLGIGFSFINLATRQGGQTD